MNNELKVKTQVREQARGLELLPKKTQSQASRGTGPRMEKGWSLGGDKGSSHAPQAPGE